MSEQAIKQATADGVRTLLAWAAQIRPTDIPQPVLRKAVLIIADDVAAAIAARDEPEVVRVHEQLLRDGARVEASFFRPGAVRTDRISAALGNGIAGSWCELDEGYRLAACHGGLYTLPALLAEAEARASNIAEVLFAAVVAYEVTARFARCWVFPAPGLHPHPQSAAVGGAIASALVRRFDARLTLDAVTAACTLVSPGDYQHAIDGALVRNVWAAVGTANGMRCADWAECGIAGHAGSPYAIYTERLGQPPAPEALIAALGEEWAIQRGYHKIHGCCQSTHSAVEATLAARAAMPAGTSARDIRRIVLETHRPGMTNTRPATTLAARFSFEHVVATAQVHARAEAFSAATLDDDVIAGLRERIELRRFEPALPRPHDRPARVTFELADGSSITRECLSAQGGPDRPFEEGVIFDKIRDVTHAACPRFGPAFERLLDLEPAQLDRPWRVLIEDALRAA
ncbi:MAG: MmgE/PrpD family protein [Betaproteobacteria bacterium]|nr:MmgE/PrpD family protein [Betaproteobacteria bacterium]